jgi:hypothetical protein
MHPSALGKRNLEAQNRILAAAETLAAAFEIDPALVSGMRVQEKDPAVRAMKEREAVADLLEALVEGTDEIAGLVEGAAVQITGPDGETVTVEVGVETEPEPESEPEPKPDLYVLAREVADEIKKGKGTGKGKGK